MRYWIFHPTEGIARRWYATPRRARVIADRFPVEDGVVVVHGMSRDEAAGMGPIIVKQRARGAAARARRKRGALDQ